MKLVYPGGLTDWALIDEDRGVMRHLAGGLAAWAPRIAFGEGCDALPLNGRTEPLRATTALKPDRHIRRVFPSTQSGRVDVLAAVMGAAPLGLPNPARRIVGYVAVSFDGPTQAPVLGPVLVTADEFGPQGPTLTPRPKTSSVASQVGLCDQAHGLRTGDALILGRALLPAILWSALLNDGNLMRRSPPAVKPQLAARRQVVTPSKVLGVYASMLGGDNSLCAKRCDGA